MVGRLRFTETSGWQAVTLAPEQLGGITVLTAVVKSTPRISLRRLKTAGKKLQRAGVTHLLVPPDFADWPSLTPYGLRPVPTENLLQALAAEIALCYLKKAGIPMEKAVVVLRGESVTAPLYAAAHRLSACLRYLSVETAGGSDALARSLWLEHGIALGPPGNHRDLTLSFSPEKAPLSAGTIPLYDSPPSPLGFTLNVPFLTLPKDCERLPFLALLWDWGKLKPRDVEVIVTETA
ncbi:MAG: hypothetical protein RR336_03665 [Oscillospiraceae bacterium]